MINGLFFSGYNLRGDNTEVIESIIEKSFFRY